MLSTIWDQSKEVNENVIEKDEILVFVGTVKFREADIVDGVPRV